MDDVLRELDELIRSREGGNPTKSYVASLLHEGGDHILKKLGEEAAETIIAGKNENLEELITATKNFEQSIKDERTNIEIAESYLDIISLDSGDRQASEHDDAAQLMTMHSAKGLEFKLVLLTGLEESLFPHGRSMESASQLEEERRLCYVAITRAMEKLYITHAESRRLHGTDTFNPPSRFLREIPKDLIDEIRPRAQTNIPYNRKDFNETKVEFEEEIGIALGQKVKHKKFGEGIVLNLSLIHISEPTRPY